MLIKINCITMTRILHYLVWITVLTTSARTQSSNTGKYSQNPDAIVFPDTVENDRQANQPILERRQKIQTRISELRRPEEPFKINLSKRGGHRKNYFTKLFLELFATLGALESELSSQVVFPGPVSRFEWKFKPEVSEKCKKLGYCESIPNYPTGEVKLMIEELGDSAAEKFQMDELDTDSVQIAQRYGSEGFTVGLCGSNVTITTPAALPDRDDSWWTVLQYPERNLTQGFRTETCINRDGKCNELAFFQHGYKGKCDQKYSYRAVYTVEKDRVKPGKRLLKIPSCCSCVITALT